MRCAEASLVGLDPLIASVKRKVNVLMSCTRMQLATVRMSVTACSNALMLAPCKTQAEARLDLHVTHARTKAGVGC